MSSSVAHNYSEPTILRPDSFPMRLFEKAKRLGVWNPSDFDFAQDRADWEAMDAERRDGLLQLTAAFLGGEEAVTLDLLPLVLAIARQGRLEEEMFLTTFLFEEAKHMDFFSRWIREVTGGAALPPAREPSVQLFDVELPNAMNALLEDQSPAAMARASVTYNMIIEGVLAETGYANYHRSLAVNDLMPGLCEGLVNIKRDESRHIAYGVYLLSRLVAEDPSVWEVIEQRMVELQPYTEAIVRGAYEDYPDGITPFGLKVDEFTEFAASQFGKRYDRISKARDRTLAEVEASSDPGDVEDLVTEI
ncbi:MAG TPA: R2-like ligand-binding oxidase [Solirubrobacteraceae bacterium]|nr:R2-like ligand-binding oxidase [Solirubrobacteraceae bacterium]